MANQPLTEDQVKQMIDAALEKQRQELQQEFETKLTKELAKRDNVIAAVVNSQSFEQTIEIVETMASKTISNISQTPTFYILDPDTKNCYYHESDEEGRNSVIYTGITDTMEEVVRDKKIKVVNSTAYIPILTESTDRPIGVLAVESADGKFKRKEVEAFKFDSWFLNTIQSNIDKEFAHQLSIKDPMTQMYNRRGLDERVARTWVNNPAAPVYGQGGEELTSNDQKKYAIVMMTDIDHFKNVNDTLGHDAGDIIIKKVASIENENTRAGSDCAARIGGEEMIVMLVGNLTGAQAIRKAEQIRRTIEAAETSVPDKNHPGRSINAKATVTVGVTFCDISDITDRASALAKFEEMKTKADEQLYIGKEAMRNVVCADRQLIDDYIADEVARIKCGYDTGSPTYAATKAKAMNVLRDDETFAKTRIFIQREIDSSDAKTHLLSFVDKQASVETYRQQSKDELSVKVTERANSRAREEVLIDDPAKSDTNTLKSPGE